MAWVLLGSLGVTVASVARLLVTRAMEIFHRRFDRGYSHFLLGYPNLDPCHRRIFLG